MFTKTFLRICCCSILIISISIDSDAQRRGRRRTATTAIVEKISTKDIDWPSKAEPALESLSPDSYTEPDCPATKAVNLKKVADSYPYLSDDGLRLYFTSNREGGHGRPFISTRKSVTAPFGSPKIVSPNLTDGFYAGSLTSDELSYCMVKGGDIYISIRKDKNEIFPVPVKMNGQLEGVHHFGASISSDGTQVVVTVSRDKGDNIRIYKRTGPYQLANPVDLSNPTIGEPGPGQLSKDGLTYTFSIETTKNEHLWRYTRTSMDAPFKNLQEVGEPMKGLRCYLQPTFNKDGSIVVFVSADENLWDKDEIYLAGIAVLPENNPPALPATVFNDINSTVSIPSPVSSPELIPHSIPVVLPEEIIETAAVDTKKTEAVTLIKDLSNGQFGIKAYPNPFSSHVYIEVEQVPADGAVVRVYDMSGRVMKQQKINNRRNTISLDRLVPGTYTFEIADNNGKQIGSGQLVKAE